MIHGEYGKFGEYPARSIPCTGCTSSASPWNSDVTRPVNVYITMENHHVQWVNPL